MYRVSTPLGIVDVTEDHSLLDINKKIVKPQECDNNTELLYGFPKEFSTQTKYNQMSKSVFLTTEELEFIKNGTAEFNKIKMGIADAELNKQGLLDRAAKVIDAFNNNERVLIEKYGADSVINMQTGEVTQKEK